MDFTDTTKLGPAHMEKVSTDTTELQILHILQKKEMDFTDTTKLGPVHMEKVSPVYSRNYYYYYYYHFIESWQLT